MLGKRPFALLIVSALAMPAVRADAGGWQEMHETSDDVKIEVLPDGQAEIQHHLRYRIVAGHFKSFDLVGVDPRAVIAPEAVFTPEKIGGPGSSEIVARVEAVAKTPGTLRIMIDEGKGLGRGAYVVDVKYKLDLVATKMLSRDGAMWKVAWTAPPAPEGHDGARVTFDLPSAPTEPRLAGASESATTLATLRRSTERDELELVRAHVPRGEAVTWAARVDPKAFPRVVAPDLRPPAREMETGRPSLIASNLSRILAAAGLALLAGLFAVLLRDKQKAFRAAAAIRRAAAEPLVPLAWAEVMRPFAYGVTTAVALALLLWGNPVVGALLVAFAMALASHRGTTPLARPRRRGAWQTLPSAQALLPSRTSPLPTDAFDLGTVRGRVAFAVIACLVGASVWLLRSRVPQIAIALPLASVALIPIFVTGTRAQLRPSPTDLAARILRPTRDELATMIDLSHVELATIGHVVDAPNVGGANQAPPIDEVRLTCLPRDRTPGLRAIDLALAPCRSGHDALPEVFVRFDQGSAAGERLARLAGASRARVVTGRTPDERVMRLSPEEPTPTAAAELVGKLLLGLEGRRSTDASENVSPTRDASGRGGRPHARWKGAERRGRRGPRKPGPLATLFREPLLPRPLRCSASADASYLLMRRCARTGGA
jgi:hypothetical protein